MCVGKAKRRQLCSEAVPIVDGAPELKNPQLGHERQRVTCKARPRVGWVFLLGSLFQRASNLHTPTAPTVDPFHA